MLIGTVMDNVCTGFYKLSDVNDLVETCINRNHVD